MTLVCRPTPSVRFMHRSETCAQATSVSHGQLLNAVAFLPQAPRLRTRRNAMLLKVCKRTTYLFLHSVKKTEDVSGRLATRLLSPTLRGGALVRDLITSTKANLERTHDQRFQQSTARRSTIGVSQFILTQV